MLENAEQQAIATLDIPSARDSLRVSKSIKPDEVLYLLGSNGSGKSTLLYHFARKNKAAILIAGNREIIFGSSAISISAADAGKRDSWAKNQITQKEARVEKNNHNDAGRLDRLLFRLNALSNDVNKRYRQAHLSKDHDQLGRINAEEPTDLVNQALAFAAIPIALDWNDKSELLAKKQQAEYGIKDMSDGERAALVLVGETLLAERSTLMLVDEPERHLHRSISSPLLQFLRSVRPDLGWVIATHDLSLPRDDTNASVAVLYEYSGGEAWNAEIIQHMAQLPPAIINAIYGAREKVIFVEGDSDGSLDLPLYKRIFPRYTVVPVGTCRDVRDSTLGLRNATSLHYMDAKGIVDGDNRSDFEMLQEHGVVVLGVYAIESVYYHPLVVEFMLSISGEDQSLNEVHAAAVKAIEQSRHLAKKAAYKSYREAYFNQILDKDSFHEHGHQIIDVDGPSTLSAAEARFDSLVEDGDWLGLVERYKIKESPSPNAIANNLGFGGAANYERAVLKALNERDDLRERVNQIVPDPFAT